ncbi:MAG: aminomethyltransferase family protein [Pseudomonadota bacterium]|nr:aminomethyltransferase family protein [Pseudomonadota bacterium]
MAELRFNALYDRHKALGASFEEPLWNMGVPWLYHTDPNDEHVAVRTRVGLWDVSCLRVINIQGPDALTVLNTMQAADVSMLKPGQSRLGCLVNEQGALTDDFLVYCDGPDRYRATHGDGDAEEVMREVATGKDVEITPDDDVHVLSVQGPKSLELLAPHAEIDLASLPYFNHKPSTLFGKKVLISRAGYSHERGYEVFCASNDAVELWDSILREGERFGVMPCSFTCLDLCRVEGGLLFYPFDMPEGDTTPWEVGMDWAVDLDKGEFRGRQALQEKRDKPRVKQTGLICKSDQAVEADAKLYKDGREVGVVTTPAYSRYLMQSLALVHVKPDFVARGTEMEVRGPKVNCKAYVWQPPFYDPLRLRQQGS